MKIKYIYLLFLLVPISAMGQDISGKWYGILWQGESYKMEINFIQQGKNLSGTSRFTNNGGNYVEEKFTGTLDGENFTIEETEVILCPPGLTCALKKLTGRFRIDPVTKQSVIDGEWSSNKLYENKKYTVTGFSQGKFGIAEGTPYKGDVSKVTITLVKKPLVRPRDGYYDKNDIINAVAAPLPVLREADVVYSRRIWREIDLREKMNQYMASPKGRLIDVIMDAIADGKVTAYDPIPVKDDQDGDQFSTPLTPEKAKLKMADSSVVNIIDKNGDKTGSKMVAGEFNPDSVIKFRIKEDVVFDKQRSVQEVRIIGIAPLVKQKIEGEAGIFLDYQPAFWIYFPELRPVLVTREAVNSRNDAGALSYDDVFTKRVFTSYIVKQSNDKDEYIKYHAIGIDRLYESEKIKKSLMDWELNLWQY